MKQSEIEKIMRQYGCDEDEAYEMISRWNSLENMAPSHPKDTGNMDF